MADSLKGNKRSETYWKRRFELLEEAQHQTAEAYLQDADRAFRESAAQVEKALARWYQRFADNNEVSLADAKRMLDARELAELKWDVKQYIRYGQENAISGQFRKQLENASARVHVSRLEAIRLQMQQQVEALYGGQRDALDQLMRRVYSEGYYHTAFEWQKGFGVGWDLQPLNEQTIERVLSKPWTADGRTFSSRIWTQQKELTAKLQTELTQALVRGETPQKAIQAISGQFNVSRQKAARLVNTETAYFASEGQRDCFKMLGVEKYEILATLDSHTSDICQSLDRQVFDMADFAPGVTAPPFHPNCRTTTVPWFEDEQSVRIAIDDQGKKYTVSSDMKYAEWKKKFVT